AEWRADGDVLHERRELVSKVTTPLCTGETRRIAATALAAIRRDEQHVVALADERTSLSLR
ncbi:MAG TPA: hypothetical protein VHS58_20365, partial [Acetobacteraceae bacterium]|nr:hypothetical protein [Acetobacteraceae bacterium]